MTRRTVALLLAVLAVGSLPVSCGDDDSDDPASKKAEFIVDASAACKRERIGLGEKASAFLGLDGSKRKPRPVLYADLAHFVLLPTIESELEAIRVLRPPPADADLIDEILFVSQIEIDKLANTSRIPSVEAVYRHFGEAARMFRAYGLPACATGPQPPAGVPS